MGNRDSILRIVDNAARRLRFRAIYDTPFLLLVYATINKRIMVEVGESKDKNVVSSPTIGLFRSAQEAARLGDDCTDKTFVITGAYSGIGV
jgi:hypothetical protein